MRFNCVMCGRFVSWDDEEHCSKCYETLCAEGEEAKMGIGDGSICYVNEDYCRHCVRKFPMSETVFNAIYGDKK